MYNGMLQLGATQKECINGSPKGEVNWLGGTTSIVAILRGTESYFTTPNDCFGWYDQDTWLSKK